MNTFHLTILRPDKVFFEGDVQKLFLTREDGEVEIMAGHMPMVMITDTGMARLVTKDEEKQLAIGHGTLLIQKDEAVLTADFIAWSDRLEQAIDNRETNIKNENDRRHRSFIEYKKSQLEIAKIFSELDRLNK